MEKHLVNHVKRILYASWTSSSAFLKRPHKKGIAEGLRVRVCEASKFGAFDSAVKKEKSNSYSAVCVK